MSTRVSSVKGRGEEDGFDFTPVNNLKQPSNQMKPLSSRVPSSGISPGRLHRISHQKPKSSRNYGSSFSALAAGFG
jgi:hypothetical protein